MAQVIAPEVWQDGIDDNQLLPNRYTVGLFTGRGFNIANDGRACRVYDILTSDYITDYDDRRVNGLGNGTEGFNADGRDGWGASAYGVFQDVKFTSKVYTMGRHRSTAFRLFDEMQYTGDIGSWGSTTDAGAELSSVSSNGQALLKTATLMSKAKDRWEKQVLGPDMDKYILFAIANGHQTGRAVGLVEDSGVNHNDHIFDGNASHYKWVAQPGTVQGQAIAPSFAPIHCIEWDEAHIPQMLQNVKVTWNNLFIDQTDRVVLIDPFYEYSLLSCLTGSGVPATDSAYTDMQNGSFTRLMGWDFNFEIPSNYWPKIYVDANLNVVHSSDGSKAYDKIINSISAPAGNDKLLKELIASDRMSRTNWIRTGWDSTNGFTKTLTNYPLGSPAFDGYYDQSAVVITSPNWGTNTDVYPWDGQGSGYGLKARTTTSPKPADEATGPAGSITLVPVIGMFLWKKAAQISQEYSEMVTDEGRTRGKFQEMCMDVKYDAWVLENYSHGIIPIINNVVSEGDFSIPVRVEGPVATIETDATLVDATLTKHTSGDNKNKMYVSNHVYNIAPATAATLSYAWSKSSTETGTYTAITDAGTSSLCAKAVLASTETTAANNIIAGEYVKCVITASGSATGTVTKILKAEYTA